MCTARGEPWSGFIKKAWRALEKLYANGKIQAIGVSNFGPDRYLDIQHFASVKPAVNQVETNPWCQMKETGAFLAKEGIAHEAWAPFAEGHDGLFTNPVLVKIAEKHDRTVGQVVLRWLHQRNVIVIPKSVHKSRMIENISIFDFELDASDMKAIAELDTGRSSFYDDRALENVRYIGTMKIHD